MILIEDFFLDEVNMEDSMIGGEDDDLEVLLEECGAVVERTNLVAKTEVRPAHTRIQDITAP